MTTESPERHIEGLSVEEELSLKEDAMDGAPVGITISDAERPDNPLIYVNDNFCSITGYDRSEILGTNCRFLQGEDTDMDKVAAMGAAVTEQKEVAVELKNYRKDGELFWNRVEIAPIRPDADEPRYFVGYQADVTDRKEAELALAAERETLDHVLSRVASLVPGIAEAIIAADTREDLEAAVASNFAAQPDLLAAWFGRYNPSTGLVRPVAGDHQPGAGIATGEAGTPLTQVVETGSVRIVEVTDYFDELPALAATALIPVQYRDTVYGVLAVGTDQPDLFDNRETVVMEAVGQAVAAALNALERVSLSGAETVIETRIEVADQAMELVALAESLGSEITADGQLAVGSDGPTLLLSLGDVPAGSVADLVSRTADLTLIGGDESTVVEWRLPDGPLASTLRDDAVRLEGLSATPTSVRLEFAAASEHMANTVIGRFREAYDGVELLAFREGSATAQSGTDFRETVTAALTDRQLEALQKAHVSGFFEWPRAVEGESLAASMDIHPSTFHQHLRAAERKLIDAYFDQTQLQS
jgi:PAS domain S-box-containing protein